jgi:DNA ligase-1
MSLNKLFAVVEELKNTNSASAKIKILAQYKNNDEIKKYFRYAYDPYYMYGVSSKNLQKNSEMSELEFFNSIFELLDVLRTRKATGNKAISLVNGYISQNYKFEELLYDFFDRNLKIGMGVTQINKALGNIIPVFDVALAATYDEDKKEKYNLDNYCIQQKMNGLRLVTHILYNDGDIQVKSYSRKGKEFTTCKKINEELLHYYKQSKYFGKDLVFDGEVCIIDHATGKEDWNRAVSEAKRKNHTMENPRYTIFDFLTLDEFSGLKVSRDYTFRRDQLFRNFFGLDNVDKFKYLNIIFATPYTEDRLNRLVQDYVVTDKWEGLIFRRADVPYKPGRSNDLLKYKLFKDAEYRVVDIKVTEKPMLDKAGKMIQVKCVGSLVIELENGNTCDVGTGLSDKQRLDWYFNPSEIIGKQILVKYKELTRSINAQNEEEWSLLFPVLLHVFEEDRDF